MNRQIKRMFPLMSILALLVGACDVQSVARPKPAGDQGAVPPVSTQMEPRPTMVSPEERDAILDRANQGDPELLGSRGVVGKDPTPGTESMSGPVSASSRANAEVLSDNLQAGNSEGSVESARAFRVAGPEESTSDVVPGDIPSVEERNAILDRVNQGGLVLPGSEGAVGEGPMPGTEMVQGSGKTRDDILDEVNRGGPVLSGGNETVGEGPAPATESVVDAGKIHDAPEEADYSILARLVDMVHSWLLSIFG
jgi:hypothetical protein